MKHNTSLKKNIMYQTIYEMLIILASILVMPYISRVLSPNGIGIYTFHYSIAQYFVLASMLGLKNYGNRSIAQAKVKGRQEVNRVFSEILSLHIATSIIVFVAYILFIILFSNRKEYDLYMLPFVASSIVDISWFYFGMEKFKTIVTIDTIVKVLNILCIFVFVRTSNDLWKYCVIMSSSPLASQLLLWIPTKNMISFVQFPIRNMTKHWKPLLVLFIPTIAISVYKYMDKIMLGALGSGTQLGLYEYSEKMVNIPIMIISAFGTVMLPRMSAMVANNDKETREKYISNSVNLVMCLAFGMAFGLAGIGKHFSVWFWGDSFADCARIIAGLSISIPFIALANIFRTQYLIPTKKDKEYTISILVGAILNFIVNALLIKPFGAIGAMIGTIIAEITVCIMHVHFTKKNLPVKQYLRTSLWYFMFGVIMFAALFMIGNLFSPDFPSVLIETIIGTVIYGILILLYMITTKNNIYYYLVGKISNIKK